jgi:hypothetical protein
VLRLRRGAAELVADFRAKKVELRTREHLVTPS